MRLRFSGLAAIAALLGLIVMPAGGAAAPRHNHHLTIAATPNPVIAGQGVLIYGRLEGTDSNGQTISLYHRLDGSGQGFTLIGMTQTDAAGYYEFTREEGVVETNRDWFVRGPDGSHSRTLHEQVVPLVSASANTTTTDTNHPIVFTGGVTPNHAHDRVFLQQEVGNGDDWRTLTSTQLDGNSQYTIAYRWRRPDVHDVRVLIRRDARNIAGASDPVTVNIQQAQVPDFTINSSEPIAPSGSSVTVSGILYQPGTTTPDGQTAVQLWGRSPGTGHFTVLGDTTTGTDGSYKFTESNLTQNVVYQVRTLRMKHVAARRSAVLFQGIQDVLSMSASPTTLPAGQPISFNGTVMPDKAGHVIYLQVQGKDGDWHTIEVGVVRHDSTFQFTWRSDAPGTFAFRARITSDPDNVGGRSAPVTVTVTVPAPASLPPAS